MQGEAHKMTLFRVRTSKAEQIVSPNQSFLDNIKKRNVHFDHVQDMHMSLEVMRKRLQYGLDLDSVIIYNKFKV